MKEYVNTIMDIVRYESPRLLRQYLLENKHWTLMERGFSNYTPLIEAVSVERLEMVVTICDYVITKNSINIFLDYLNQTTTDGKNAVIIATCMNHKPDIIEYLISHGINYDLKDNSGKGVMEYAVFSPSEEIEIFWNNFDPKKYQETIKHNIDPNTIRQRGGED